MSDGHAHAHHNAGAHSHHHQGWGGAAHSPETGDYDRAFALGIALNVAFVATEFGCGVWANSTALLADAGHNLSDVASLAAAWGAARLARRGAQGRYTYGFGRATILAAIANAFLLLFACGAIVWEAIERLGEPMPVRSGVVMAVAALGIALNGATALLFARGRKRDANIRGAFLHMAADAAVSFGVVLAGLAIALTGQTWFDPLVTAIIAAVIVWGAARLLFDALGLALDAAPKAIDLAAVREYLRSLPGARSAHDVHVWALGANKTALTAHLLLDEQPPEAEWNLLLETIRRELERRFDISHSTIQIEMAGDSQTPCRQDCGGGASSGS